MMNRFSRNDFLRAGDDPDDVEERLYERQALILDDNNDVCDDEINTGQLVMRLRQSTERDKQRDTAGGCELKRLNTRTYKDSNSDNSPVEFTYYDIQPGDSLQSICLRYACQINQVKRLNGLMADLDFYGLRRLKLPLGKLGLLEDLLEQQKPNRSQDLLMLDAANNDQIMQHQVNSPGSALLVATRQNNSSFKPLLNPGYSSDGINELHRSKFDKDRSSSQIDAANVQASQMINSQSFSSLKDFASTDTNISMNNSELFHPEAGFSIKLPQKGFIRTEISDPNQINIDSLLTNEQPAIANVFEDLDYHVEKVKVAAESYEQRAAELMNAIDPSNTAIDVRGPQPKKIPELFFSGENFELNIKRLVMLIVFVCFIIPLVYINHANVIK